MTIVAEATVPADHGVPLMPALAQDCRAREGEYLTFRLGGEDYGIDILLVQEIRGWEEPTRIAGAPASLRGVLNLRGVIVPIVDLRSMFGLEAAFDAVTVTMVLNVAGLTVGAVVDAVADVVALKPGQIKEAPAFCGAPRASHITGLGTVQHGESRRMLILLDIQRLMAAAETGLAAQSVA